MKSRVKSDPCRFKKTGWLCAILIFIGPAFFCGLAFLSGCAGKEEVQPVEITLVHGWGGTAQTHKTVREIYQEFSAQRADVILNEQASSDSTIAVEKANDMLAVDRMPDVVSTNGLSYFVQNAVSKGMALDLMPYIEADEELKASIHPSVLESWTTEDGKLYTLPDALEVMGFWYNESFFREAGITGADGNVKLPDTWDEFFEDCDKLDAWCETQNSAMSVFALENIQVVEDFLLARLAGASEEGFAMASAMPSDFDTPSFQRTLQDVARLYTYSQNVDNIDNARQAFLDGRSVIYFNGVWECDVFRGTDIEEEIGYAAYPTESGASLSYISPSSGYVLYDNPDPKRKEAGIEFLKYMLSTAVQNRLATDTGQAPSNPHVDNTMIREKYPLLGNALEAAHGADLQIKSISSVWDAVALDTLKSQLQQACQSEEGRLGLINRLNEKHAD
ncbi:ABC transporter substrate-binding protein [Diplocloster hominis]|uniref:ABC transporter substrate-binding protein n=1 Tax=Diplocloster hominis TaxID=3079010 RepID=UPI0031BAE4B0